MTVSAEVRERQLKLLHSLNGSVLPKGFVVLLSEKYDMVMIPRERLQEVFEYSLSEQVVASVDKAFREGLYPVLVYVDGWLHTHAVETAMLSKGGSA